MRRGLTSRTFAATAVLAAIVGLSFAVLLAAVMDLRDSISQSRRAQEVLVVANNIERLVIDLETGERGFLLTDDPRFLQPWSTARRALPSQQAELRTLVADEPRQEHRVDWLIDAISSYIVDHSVPLVESAQDGASPPDLGAALNEGKRRLDEMRGQFDAFISEQSTLVLGLQRRADAHAQRAVLAAVGGLTASLALLVLYTAYLRRAVVRPLLRAAGLAFRLSEGDLDARMPESGVGEIGQLERSFNSMASSLAESHDNLQRVAGEQASLRRVATLVAEGQSSEEIFSAVAEEMALVFDADASVIHRLDTDGTSTLIAAHGDEADVPPVGARIRPASPTATGTALSTGHSARIDDVHTIPGSDIDIARRTGIRSAVASPIFADGRLWGAVAIGSRRKRFASDTEQRMGEFCELIATAVASAQSRSELIASRARIVAAADDARRRIERDLHDSAQQRLVTLGLEIRDVESQLPGELSEAREQLARIGDALDGVLEELRELSRGIHPAILSQGGLVPALKALARRSPIPVDLHTDIGGRLPKRVEVAAYYLLSEALTNATKHAEASLVEVHASARDGALEVSISDDGVGGADPTRGSGLIGMGDRAAALGGSLEIISPRGRGTTMTARLPISVQ